ncbi:MAG TPA: TIGR03435 family protein [Bryobacteraceae bacterium]|nr:TIGR03435 family protein [Bryobacteraceae bacterium]
MLRTSCLILTFCLAAPAAGQEFEVASIKPNASGSDMVRLDFHGGRLTAENVSLRMLVMRAFKAKDFEISGGPSWMNSDRFDIAATAAASDGGEDLFRLLLRSLLESRFKLVTHRATREMAVYALTPVRKGSKLPEATAACVPFDPHAPPPQAAPGQAPPMLCGGFMMDGTHLEGRKISMAQFVAALSNMLGRSVTDRTEYDGTFDIHLEFAAEGVAGLSGGGFSAPRALAMNASDPDSAKQTIFTAIQRQLGLRLQSRKAPVGILVIDRAEKPGAN